MLISVVTTLYRSSAYLEEFYGRTRAALSAIDCDVEFIFVDDGSPDDSAAVARGFFSRGVPVTVVELSRNFGHHRAILTGLEYARGDLIYLIDCDLEEPPELIATFYRALLESRANGNAADVVYAVPQRRKGGWFERVSGAWFYRVFNVLSDVQIPNNWMIARLMTARYVRALLSHRERELFLGGLLGITGFRQLGITAAKGHKGSTEWTLSRKLRVALGALVAFSPRPLWFVAGIGLAISSISFAAILYVVITELVNGHSYLAGWASTIVTITFFGGLNLLAIGLVGLYIAQIFVEVKGRPCIIKEVDTNFERKGAPSLAAPDHMTTMEGARRA